MKHRIFYGSAPSFTDADRERFSRNGYECRTLMKDRRGRPVVISESKDPGFPVWKVEYSCPCVVFASCDEAMAFCQSCFAQ